MDDAFARAALQRLENRVDPPHDVVGVLEVRIRVAGLDRRVPYVGGTGMEQSVNLLPADANVTRVLAIDFAKTIVGHTTPTSALLWFNLLASVVTSGSYVCEVRARSSGDEVASIPLAFNADDPRIATADLTGLTPGETYEYSLALLTSSLGPGDIDISVATDEAGGGGTRRVGVSRVSLGDVGPADAGTAVETIETRIHPGIPRDRRELARGEFTTPAADATGLTLVFGSCHRPTWEETLERWHALSRRTDYELALLIGDQIYEDEIVPLGDTWFERYVGRYHQFFSYWPMREVMRRTPTYMIFDDHDVKDDWGITEVQDEGRVDAALDAYRRFQQAHNPGGPSGRPSTTTSRGVRRRSSPSTAGPIGCSLQKTFWSVRRSGTTHPNPSCSARISSTIFGPGLGSRRPRLPTSSCSWLRFPWPSSRRRRSSASSRRSRRRPRTLVLTPAFLAEPSWRVDRAGRGRPRRRGRGGDHRS